MDIHYSILSALISSALFSFMFLTKVQRICFVKKLFDSFDERKVHTGIIPRLGGVSFLPAMSLAFLMVVSANLALQTTLVGEINPANLVEWLLLFCAVILLYFTGIADDLVDLRYRNKLIIQVFVAILFVASGVWINNLHGLLGFYEIHPAVGIPLTVFIIVYVINAFNFIDGIDGLAAGVAILGFLFFGIAFLFLGLHIWSILAFSALGMMLPFFYFNVYGKAHAQRKIFMGDTGTLTIGMLLAVFALKVYHSASLAPDHSYLALVLGFAVLIVPMLDAFRVVLFRLLKRKNPFKPDRNHLHHQLLDLGFSHKVATLLMLSSAIFFGAITFLCIPYLDINLLLGGIILLWSIFDFVLRSRKKSTVRATSHSKVITPINTK